MSCCLLILSLHSSIFLSCSPENTLRNSWQHYNINRKWMKKKFSVKGKRTKQLTHLCCAVVNVSMVALNSSHGILTTSAQLLTNNIFTMLAIISKIVFHHRGAEVAWGHGGPPPKSLDSDENFMSKHTLFCRKLRFVAINGIFDKLVVAMID